MTPVHPTAPGRGRIGDYALWQLRDYSLNRGVPTLIIGVLLLLQVAVISAEVGRGALQEQIVALVGSLLQPFVLIGALVAINGIISHDRRHGFYRFLFAKPVSIVRYYLQAFVVHGAGLTAATALFLCAVWLVSGAAPPARTVLYPVFYYLLLGGLGFLFSALLRSDWVLIAATFAVTQLARLRWADDPGPIGWIVRWLLPPFHVLDDVQRALLAGGTPDWRSMLWPVLYGVLAVAAGVVLLRRKALGG